MGFMCSSGSPGHYILQELSEEGPVPWTSKNNLSFISEQVSHHPPSKYSTVLPAKSDSDFMFCLQSYQGLIIDRSLVY